VKLLILAGDGIGPEVTREAVATLEVCARSHGLEISSEEGLLGGIAIDTTGKPLPDDVLRRAQAADAILLGAVGGPKWDNPNAAVRPEQALLGLRKELGLFANLRPVKVVPQLIDAAPLKAEILRDVDLVVVRELTGGIYFGKPSEERSGPNGREAVDTCLYSEEEIVRVLRASFELARRRRRKITSVDKANVLSTSRLWRSIAVRIAKEYPEVAFENVLVDAMAMHLLRRPRDFDVVVTENLFGDILTDEASMLAGSMGMLPSASLGAAKNSLGHARGLYEPIHGSAPDIAGQDKANPLASILSAAMLLRHSAGAEAAAAAIEDAVMRVLDAGLRTPDIAPTGTRAVGCREMGERVREALRQGR